MPLCCCRWRAPPLVLEQDPKEGEREGRGRAGRGGDSRLHRLKLPLTPELHHRIHGSWGPWPLDPSLAPRIGALLVVARDPTTVINEGHAVVDPRTWDRQIRAPVT